MKLQRKQTASCAEAVHTIIDNLSNTKIEVTFHVAYLSHQKVDTRVVIRIGFQRITLAIFSYDCFIFCRLY